jgi:hypothetical protein
LGGYEKADAFVAKFINKKRNINFKKDSSISFGDFGF